MTTPESLGRARSGWHGLLFEVLVVLLLGYAVFLLLRSHVLEYYNVPTKSMEPTLHGDPRRGDLVLVDKTAFLFGARPRVFDMVVVRPPAGESRQLVKRVAAVGPCQLQIQDGDLFVGSLEGEALQRVVKDPLQHAHMRVPVFRFPTGDGADLVDFVHLPPELLRAEDGKLRIAAAATDVASLLRRVQNLTGDRFDLDGRLPGFVATHKPVETCYLDADGLRQQTGMGYTPDIGMQLELELRPGVEAVLLVYEHRGRSHTICWRPASGDVTVARNAGQLRPMGRLAPLAEGLTARVAFGHLDGNLFFAVEEQAVQLAIESQPFRFGVLRENGLHWAVVGTGAVQLSALEVFRDIHYEAERLNEGEPLPVDADRIFLLGDNTLDSRDSRALGTFHVDDLVGRPVMILAPWRRFGRLRR